MEKLEAARISPTIGMVSRIADGLQLDLTTLLEGVNGPSKPRLDLDTLTECEREFVAALARFLADRRRQDTHPSEPPR